MFGHFGLYINIDLVCVIVQIRINYVYAMTYASGSFGPFDNTGLVRT